MNIPTIEKRLSKITSGDWVARPEEYVGTCGYQEPSVWSMSLQNRDKAIATIRVGLAETLANQDFIANSKKDITQLLRLVRAQHEALLDCGCTRDRCNGECIRCMAISKGHMAGLDDGESAE